MKTIPLKIKNVAVNFKNIDPTFLLYFAFSIVIYFWGSSYIENLTDEELNQFKLEKFLTILEPLKTLNGAIVGLIIILAIFYMGKIHDFLRDFLNKLGDFEELNLVVQKLKNRTHVKDEILEVAKKITVYKERYEIYKESPAAIISLSFMMLLFFVYISFQIFQYEKNQDIRQFLLMLVLLFSGTMLLISSLWFFETMLSNRRRYYKELIFDIAKLKAELNDG